MWFFAYGTNMDRGRLEVHRAIRVREVWKGELDNHRLVFDKVSSIRPATGCANIVPETGCRVLGVLYRIRDEDMAKMDIFEGVSAGRCHRERVLVRREDNTLVEADVYIADETKADLGPSCEYLDWVLKGARESGLDESYVEETFGAPLRRALAEAQVGRNGLVRDGPARPGATVRSPERPPAEDPGGRASPASPEEELRRRGR